MFGYKRRQMARAALDRIEQKAMQNALDAEALRQRANAAEKRCDELRRLSSGLEKRLDDANAELARWGLEPVTRDLPESDEHPQRYRRSMDWRTTRTQAELEAMLARSIEFSAPANVDVAFTFDRSSFDASAAERVATGRYESDAPVIADEPPDDEPTPLERLLIDPENRRMQRELEAAGWANVVTGVPNWPATDEWRAPDGVRWANMRAAWNELKRRQSSRAAGWGGGEFVTIEDGTGRTATITRAKADLLYEHVLEPHVELVDDCPACMVDQPRQSRTAALEEDLADVHAVLEGCRSEYRDVDAARQSALGDLAAMTQRAEVAEEALAAARSELRSWQGAELVPADTLSTRASEAEAALEVERVEREQAERSRDKAQARTQELELDLEQQREWRAKEREALVALTNELIPADKAGTLHPLLRAPFARALELVGDPDS